MSRPPIQTIKLSEHLKLHECHPDSECSTNNWWLWDSRAGHNLAMRAKTREEALVKAVNYWAKRYVEIARAYGTLKDSVDSFVSKVHKCDEEEGT